MKKGTLLWQLDHMICDRRLIFSIPREFDAGSKQEPHSRLKEVRERQPSEASRRQLPCRCGRVRRLPPGQCRGRRPIPWCSGSATYQDRTRVSFCSPPRLCSFLLYPNSTPVSVAPPPLLSPFVFKNRQNPRTQVPWFESTQKTDERIQHRRHLLLTFANIIPLNPTVFRCTA